MADYGIVSTWEEALPALRDQLPQLRDGPMTQLLLENGIMYSDAEAAEGRQLSGIARSSYASGFMVDEHSQSSGVVESIPMTDTDGAEHYPVPDDELPDAWEGRDLGAVELPEGLDLGDEDSWGWTGYRPTNFASAERAVREQAANSSNLPRRSTPITSLPSSGGPAAASGMQNYLDSVRQEQTDAAPAAPALPAQPVPALGSGGMLTHSFICLLYTSDAADE